MHHPVVLLLFIIVLPIDGLELHQLTGTELMHLFGTESILHVPTFELAYVRPHRLQKRSLLPNGGLFYELQMEGRNVTLHLLPNTKLISPHFELIPDNLNVNMTAAAECLYHGKVLGGTGRAAVSTCGGNGLAGMIETDFGRYHLLPVPARLQDNDVDQGHMHVVIPKNETGTFCGVHELNTPQKLMDALTLQAPGARHRRADSPMEKLYIETAVFADFMLYRSLVGKSLLADHDAFVKYVLAIVNTVQLIYNEASLGRSVEIVLVRLEILQNENLPFYNEEVDKYLWDFCKWQSGLNPGTDVSTPKHWDHAIILTGFDLRSGNIRSVTGYAPVGGMCNPVYSCTINEGNHFGAAFVIAHEMGHSLTMQHDGQAGVSGNGCDAQSFLMSPSTGRGKTTWSTCSRNYLEAFLQSSQSTCLKDVPPGRDAGLNPGTDVSTPKHWDHAIILTGFDLRSGNIRSVTGYAPVGGMCNPVYSCTINEGNHFGAAFVIAHEMGHSLTMQHDGQAGVSGNGCDAQSFLMSPSTGRGKTTWSTCSRNYLEAFLQSSQSTCLKDVPPGRDGAIDFYSGNLPGQVYPPDDQCRLLYGVEFHRYTMQPDADVCEILICANTSVYITGHPALPGTFCGQGHWCIGGSCISWGSQGPIAIDGGWSVWPTTAECTANCVLPGSGLRIFNRGCTNPLPANGGKQCEGKSKRYRTCDQSSLCDLKKILSINEFSNQHCLKTKTVQSDATLTGTGRQRLQDPTGGCVIWCDTFQGGYKTWGTKFPDGIDCSRGTGKAFCLDGQCREFGCDGWTVDESSPATCPTAENKPTTGPLVAPSAKDGQQFTAMSTMSGDATTTPRTLLFPNDNPFYATMLQTWSSWESAGPCVSSCLQNSTGLNKVVRRCRETSGVCYGRNVTVSRCTATCPKVFFTADMYVGKICSALKTIDPGLTGTGKQLPHSSEDSRQACKLWCEKETTLRSWPDMYFPDGTLCHMDGYTAAFCLKGSCTPFGCDGKPVDLSDPSKCSSSLSDERLMAAKKLFVSGKPSVIEYPQSGQIPFTAFNGTVRYQWMVVTAPCSAPCGGGTRKNHVQCTQVSGIYSKGSQKSDETNCDVESKPTALREEICNTQACPQWNASGWKDCNVACGNGTETRLVQCVQSSPPVGNVTVETILDDMHCDPSIKPPLARGCTARSCSRKPLSTV